MNNFKDTLLRAKTDIWRGPFDQILEVDEEVLRTSRYLSNHSKESSLVDNRDIMIPEVDSNKEENLSGKYELIKNVALASSEYFETDERSF